MKKFCKWSCKDREHLEKQTKEVVAAADDLKSATQELRGESQSVSVEVDVLKELADEMRRQ